MWSSIILVFTITCSQVGGQRSARQQGEQGSGQGWDIRLAVPGEPGNDYPTLGGIPKTSFSCSGKQPGYYADMETNCQAFRVCTSGSTFGFQSFLCPNGTLFNQAVFVCDWWMNVNCENSQKYTTSNDQKFGNLKLGPQLMNDVKKMLTHPMRNPYDKNTMKSNYVVMQDYKPPSGQLFPNAPLLLGSNKVPENLYVPAKQIQANFGLNGNKISDNNVAGSTPSPLYSTNILNNIQNPQRDIEVFQRQRQNGQYVQTKKQNQNAIRTSLTQPFYNQNTQNQNGQKSQNIYNKQNGQYQNNFVNSPQNLNLGNINSNGHVEILTKSQTQNSAFTNSNLASQESSRQNHNYFTGNGQIRQEISSIGNQPTQIINLQKSQQSGKALSLQNNGKLSEFGISFTKQQHNTNQEINTPLPQFSKDISGTAGNEAKQNLALVYSFLADSLNQAKEYRNLAEQNLVSTTSHTQFQNIDNEELAKISNNVAQLTSAQYTNQHQTNFAANGEQTSQLLQGSPQHAHLTQIQSEHTSKLVPQQHSGQFHLSQFQTGSNAINANLQFNNGQNQLYSGQLYQVPVPDVSSIYNGQPTAKLITHNIIHPENTEFTDLRQNSNNKQTSSEVEIIQSQSLPLPAPAKLQTGPSLEEQSFTSQEDSTQSLIGQFVNSGNAISAQVRDKIVGTIQHPLEENKLVTYKKDQSYFVYTNLDNVQRTQSGISGSSNNVAVQQNAKLKQSNNDNNVVTFQFIPSVSYQLEDEKDQQKLLNAFQINEFGSPIRNVNNANKNQNENTILTSNVDYSVQHSNSDQENNQYNNPNNLYAGPSSYSAPQGSVGRLGSLQGTVARQNNQQSPARIEQFDENSNNGYGKTSPVQQFTF